MPGIDQLLSLVVAQGANELRLAVDQEPQMFENGQRKRLTMAKTSDFALRHLVAELLTTEKSAKLRKEGHLALDYDVEKLGRFRVNFTEPSPDALRVLFQLSRGSKSEPLANPDCHGSSQSPAPERRNHRTETTLAPQVELLPQQEPLPRRPPSVAELPHELAPSAALEQLIHEAFSRQATDIHLADGQPIFYRVHGRLLRLEHSSTDSVAALLGISEPLGYKIMSGHSADFALDIGPAERLRISVFRSASGLSSAIRLLPREAPDLRALNLPLPIDDLADLTQGLVLVCGATGSGKSTTLAALASLALKRRSIVLTTLEDPIEFALPQYEHSVARRRQVGRDVCDFRTGLRDALRGDPDVILVGELRDPDTIQLALTAAETGHLVLASLHSSGAASSIERIVDAYPAESRTQIRVQLADVLKAVVAQRLVPQASGQGRVVALELLRVTQAVANIIREGRTAQLATVLQAGKREGMISMDRCLAEYVRTGHLTLAQAQAVASDKESLLNLMARG